MPSDTLRAAKLRPGRLADGGSIAATRRRVRWHALRLRIEAAVGWIIIGLLAWIWLVAL
jgi:hypothetical protein